MPLRRTPQSTPAAIAARRSNSLKSSGPRTSAGKHRTSINLKRYFGRLVGVPEALALDQEPGAAIHLYEDLIAPYEPAPALLAMHFRDLARLQLELEAWEGIRDAEMKHRAEQTMVEQQRRGLESDRELRATSSHILDTGLCRMDDSGGKFNAQCDALWTIRELVKLGKFADLIVPLSHLYGIKREPDTACGMMICASAERLMPPEQDASWAVSSPASEPTAEGDAPRQDDERRQQDVKELLELVEAEERRAMEAWELALYERRMTTAASQARLAPRREDHWMNRQGDRLRQAVDRKMRFTPILLRMLGLRHVARRVTGPDAEGGQNPSAPPKLECPMESAR